MKNLLPPRREAWNLASFPLCALFITASLTGSSFAGAYSQNYTTTPADGSLWNSSVAGVATVTGGQLRLTQNGTGSTLSALRLPDLDPGNEISEFTLDYDVTLYASATPADGYALTFGNIPSAAGDLINGTYNGGEEGFNVLNGLAVIFDIYNNGNSEAPAVDAEANGIIVRSVYMGSGSPPGGVWSTAGNAYPCDNVKRHVYIHWEVNTGLDVKITGTGATLVDVMVDQPVPGFTPTPGNVFAWGARTGGSTEDVILDNISITTVPVTPIATGGPVLSEIVVDNANISEDEDCDSGSWLEIYNGQNAVQSLAGWYLTDDPLNLTKWTFPAGASMSAYQYAVVWADAKNRTTSPYHTNFSLVKTGGYLALVRPDLSVASVFNYGQQAEDVAYGTLGAAQTLGYLETPTPAFKNSGTQAAGPPASDDVVFSRDGGIITGPVPLDLAPPVAAGAVARYTTDNSVPNASSTPWPVGGLNVSGSMNIRVRYFEAGKLGGNTSSRTFILADSTLTNYRGSGLPFSSNLPILVFHSFGVDIDNAGGSPGLRPYRNAYGLSINTDPTNGNKASITGPIDMQNRGGLHLRGETSAGFAQRPYAWEVWDNKERDKKVSLLGWPSESDFVLISNYNDKSILRNMMPFDMMRSINGDGRAMKERYVEVFFKQTGSSTLSYSDYRGIYVLTEKVKRDKDRVDIEQLRTCDGVFANNPAVDDVGVISGGYIIRKDKASPETAFTTTGGGGFPAQTFQIVEPNAPSSAQQNYIRGYVNRFEAALYGASFADPANGYAKYIDVDTFIDGHLWVEIFKQIDGYRLSTYMYKDRNGKLKYSPLWDYNLCMGNGSPAGGYPANYELTNDWYYVALGTADYPYHPRLFQDPAFKARYWDRYWQLRRGPFSNANINATIEGYIAQLKGAGIGNVTNGTGTWPSSVPTSDNPIGRHHARWQRLGIYDWPNATNPTTRTFWEQPLDYTTINTSTNPFGMNSETAFVKSWIIRRLMWMDDMSLLYGTNANATSFRPPNYSQYGGNVNSGFVLGISDVNGITTGGTIYYTTDGSDPSTGGGTALNGGTLTLVSDTGPVTYLVPSTTNGGSTLTRTQGDPNQWNGIANPPNLANWSTGTLGLGYDYNDSDPPVVGTDVLFGPYIGTNVQALMQPPGGPNNATIYLRMPFNLTAEQIAGMGAFRLLARYDDSYIAYVNGVEVVRKLYNVASTPAYNTQSLQSHADTAGIVMEGVDLASFKNLLVPGTNMLAIHAMNGSSSTTSVSGKDFLIQPRLEATVAGTVTLTQTSEVKSRVLDSTGRWSPLTAATFVINAVPASAANIVVSELNYNPAPPTPAETTASGADNANDFEFIEILNISNDTVDLTNCQFTTGITFQWASAPLNKQTLGPGARMIIAENTAAFNARYGTKNANVAGAFSGNLSNGGEQIILLAANGQVIKSFTYDDAEPWPVDADLDLGVGNVILRGGYSLVLNTPLTNPDHNVGTNWRSSAVMGGCPGQADALIFGGSPTGDTDGDGLPDVVEFAMGSNQATGTSMKMPELGWGQFVVNGVPETCLSLSFTRNLNADVNLWPEVSSDLAAWQDGSVSLTYVQTQNNGDGTATVTWRSTQPISALPARLFAKLNATLP